MEGKHMRYGVVFPFDTVQGALRLAKAAEVAGWDGLFVADGIFTLDPWVVLAAVATRTTRLRIGPLLTPVSRRRPSKLAGEVATLDQLSNGRVILSVGLGALDTGFANFGEETDRKIRAERLDEGLEIITRLWTREPFDYSGKHYQVKAVTRPLPAPVQTPRVPIWVVGAWPHEKSVQRALRWDGWLTAKPNADGSGFAAITPDDIREMAAYAKTYRAGSTPFDIVIEGETPLGNMARATATVRPFAEAGATWWIESLWMHDELEYLHARIQQGPPRMDEN
jgi:alkanesulfonate monooxygenase SsuD/methylene tetrahydromethanopterin reductase-like flavin-dependent oxidoreductase (luciferase family)